MADEFDFSKIERPALKQDFDWSKGTVTNADGTPAAPTRGATLQSVL